MSFDLIRDKVENYSKDYKDWWNPIDRMETIWNCFQKIDLHGKNILETGSRFGDVSYVALLAGAKHVTGVEFQTPCVKAANKLFEKTEFGHDRYTFINQSVYHHKQHYDLILYVGLYYNIPQQEALLRDYHNYPEIMVESHIRSWRDDFPVSTWITTSQEGEDRILDANPIRFPFGKGKTQQYFSNKPKLEQSFKRSGYEYENLGDWKSDTFYLLKPNGPIEKNNNRWGMNGITEAKYI